MKIFLDYIKPASLGVIAFAYMTDIFGLNKNINNNNIYGSIFFALVFGTIIWFMLIAIKYNHKIFMYFLWFPLVFAIFLFVIAVYVTYFAGI